MARSSSPLGPPVVLATPPRLSPFRDDSDLDDLPDEPIPATSPYVTQPTQVVSNPRTTLKRASPPPPASDSSLSSSPPQQASKPPKLPEKPAIPRRDQKISRFFPRPLPMSPKTTAEAPPSRTSSNGSRPKPMVPQKRASDLIELSDDDDEDELLGDRADIKPTNFSRLVSLPFFVLPYAVIVQHVADFNASSLGPMPQTASPAKRPRQS